MARLGLASPGTHSTGADRSFADIPTRAISPVPFGLASNDADIQWRDNVNGGTERPEERRTDGQREIWAELLGTFGPVKGSAMDAELVTDGPPWHPVEAGDEARLLAAFVQAGKQLRELRAALRAAGLRTDEFPELCASVDEDGLPVVGLGRVTLRTSKRLAAALGRDGNPPARQGQAA